MNFNMELYSSGFDNFVCEISYQRVSFHTMIVSNQFVDEYQYMDKSLVATNFIEKLNIKNSTETTKRKIIVAFEEALNRLLL